MELFFGFLKITALIALLVVTLYFLRYGSNYRLRLSKLQPKMSPMGRLACWVSIAVILLTQIWGVGSSHFISWGVIQNDFVNYYANYWVKYSKFDFWHQVPMATLIAIGVCAYFIQRIDFT